jgi:hypothetical protein
MEDINSELHPFSPESLTAFLIISIIMGTLLVLVILTDKVIIPLLNPENIFVKWWKKHIMDINPFEKK